MLVYTSVIACAALLAWMVYRYDLYDKEPWYTLLFALALGYLTFRGMGYAEDATNRWFGYYGIGDHTSGQAAVAASHEELAKLLGVALVAVLFRRHFNDPMDGLIYGSFIALGMALEESFFYLGLSFAMPLGETSLELFGREAVRLVLHVLLGGITGFGLGLAVARPRLRHWVRVMVAWLAVSVTLHFLWDWLVGIPSVMPDETVVSVWAELFQRGTAVVLMLTAMAGFGYSVTLGTRLSKAQFAPDAEPPREGGPVA